MLKISVNIVEKDGKAYKFKTATGDTVYLGSPVDSEFHPKITLNRWKGECWLKLGFDDSKITVKSDSLQDNKVKLETALFDFHYFPVENGLEFEIVLKQKPPSNAWAFPIETQGLKFLYQAPLTQEEIDDGCFRPDNIVGSYAVYHALKKNNKYKAGKAFHIYRPKLKDATGKEAWATLDITNNTLTITLPEDFLNNATYPVTVDPNFGYETAGGSYTTAWTTNDLFGSVHTSPSDAGTADSITVYWQNSWPTSKQVKGVIVLHSNLNILSNGVGNAAARSGGTTGWTTSTFGTSPTLSGTTDYVLMAINDTSSARLYYDTGDTDQSHDDELNSFASPTNPTDAVHGTREYSIYCTYTAAAGASMPVFMRHYRNLRET